MGLFSKSLGIDLGTVNTRIYKEGSGIILSEPSVVALDRLDGKILAVGTEANEMIGRTPDSIVAVRPVKDGVIADFDITRAMLRNFISESNAGGILKPRALFAIPCGITEVEKRAVEEAAITAGAKSVSFVEKPLAAAVGAGIDIYGAKGNMVVDIGGGTCEAAVVSLGGIVSSRSVRIAGDALDSSIINYVKKELGINIGDRMAEEVKTAVGNAFDDGTVKSFTVRGRDVSSGLPKQAEITYAQAREAMHDNICEIIDAVKITLEHTPPELASDVMENGITVTGGSANIRGLCAFIKSQIGIKAEIAGNALDCVVLGTGAMLGKISKKK